MGIELAEVNDLLLSEFGKDEMVGFSLFVGFRTDSFRHDFVEMF